MNDRTEPVTVSLLDRQFQFACSPDERDSLRTAAQHLDERLRAIKSSSGLVSLERIAVMAALNLAAELLQLRGELDQRAEVVDQRIRTLADELDDALGSAID